MMRRVAAAGILLGCLPALAACMESHAGQRTTAVLDTGEAQPRSAAYACEDGSVLAVENGVTQVSVTDADGESFVLPASPAEQRSRYGSEGRALVLDGQDALWMKGNREPLPCRR